MLSDSVSKRDSHEYVQLPIDGVDLDTLLDGICVSEVAARELTQGQLNGPAYPPSPLTSRIMVLLVFMLTGYQPATKRR